MPITAEQARQAHELTIASDWIVGTAPDLPSAGVWSKNELFWTKDYYEWDFAAEEYDIGLVLLTRQVSNQRVAGRVIGQMISLEVPRNIPKTSAVLSWEDGFAEEWSFCDVYHPSIRVRKTRWDYIPTKAELRKYRRTFYEEDEAGLLSPTIEEIERLKNILEVGEVASRTVPEQGLNDGEA